MDLQKKKKKKRLKFHLHTRFDRNLRKDFSDKLIKEGYFQQHDK